MLGNIHPKQLLFLDIETVPKHASFSELSSEEQLLWEKKTQYRRKEDISAEEYYPNAGIWAEFGKIICISVGYFKSYNATERQLRITSFYGEEKKLLNDFKKLLQTHFNTPQHLLCAHNGKEFDFPYISRRMLVHGIKLPEKLQLFGKKPWEVPHLDTMELWRFGDYKSFTSLQLLTHILGIESPKEDLDGTQIQETYYQHRELDKIVEYCQRDVVAVAQVFLRLRGENILSEGEITWV